MGRSTNNLGWTLLISFLLVAGLTLGGFGVLSDMFGAIVVAQAASPTPPPPVNTRVVEPTATATPVPTETLVPTDVPTETLEPTATDAPLYTYTKRTFKDCTGEITELGYKLNESIFEAARQEFGEYEIPLIARSEKPAGMFEMVVCITFAGEELLWDLIDPGLCSGDACYLMYVNRIPEGSGYYSLWGNNYNALLYYGRGAGVWFRNTVDYNIKVANCVRTDGSLYSDLSELEWRLLISRDQYLFMDGYDSSFDSVLEYTKLKVQCLY